MEGLGLSLIDVSSEDDFLISSEGAAAVPISVGNQFVGDCSTLETADAYSGNSLFKMTKHIEQALHMSESLEHKQNSSKCNLRKSLAWDAAFFTNEGVLDPEELAIVNCTFKKVEVSLLPSIAEDVRKSTESTSTLDNDSCLLENLEVELFDNVRASIQKSLGYDDKVTKVVCPIAKKSLKKMDTRPLKSLKMIESSTHNKKKTPTLDAKCVSNQQTKQASREDINGGTTSKGVLKPPRILSRSTLPTITSKGTSASRNIQTGTATSKVLSGKVPSQKSVAAPKKLNGTLNSNTSTSLKSLRPTMTSSSQDISSTSCASYTSSISNSYNTTSKPTSDATRKKIASRNADCSSESMAGKIPTKITRTKLVDRKPSNTYVDPSSTTKHFSTISPNSSFDSMASGSSSASFVFKSSTENSDPGSSSSLSYCSPIKDLVISPRLELSLGNESHGDCSLSQSIKGPGEMFVRAESSRGNTRGSNNISAKSLKPTGFKMPTPKLGYFDAEKSITRNVETISHTRQRGLMKTSTDVSKTVMETIPNNNLGTMPQVNPQHKSPQSTGGATMSKKNAANKLNSTNPQPINTSSWSMTMNNPGCSPVQSLNIRTPQNVEPVMIELPESADSCSISSTVEAYHDPHVVQKTPSPVKDCYLKIPTVETEENNKVASEKLMTAPSVGDGLLNSIMNTPLQENTLAFKEENPDLNSKSSRKDSWVVAMENQGTNQKQCHFVTAVTDKENILPVGNTDVSGSHVLHKNMGGIIELLGDEVSSLTIVD